MIRRMVGVWHVVAVLPVGGVVVARKRRGTGCLRDSVVVRVVDGLVHGVQLRGGVARGGCSCGSLQVDGVLRHVCGVVRRRQSVGRSLAKVRWASIAVIGVN